MKKYNNWAEGEEQAEEHIDGLNPSQHGFGYPIISTLIILMIGALTIIGCVAFTDSGSLIVKLSTLIPISIILFANLIVGFGLYIPGGKSNG